MPRFGKWSKSAAAAVACTALAGCSLFGQTVDPKVRDRVHAALKPGLSMDEAESTLLGMNFSCATRGGDFSDETGHDRSAPRFLHCIERPGTVSFSCMNRDQVYVVPRDGVVHEVNVVRGPDCAEREGKSSSLRNSPEGGNTAY